LESDFYMVNGETMMYNVEKDPPKEVGEIIVEVFKALQEKGYDPINQIVGYILSGDPTYITNHLNARGIIRRVERDELLEELVQFYIKKNSPKD
jgi:uncharacterized protein (UPF0297 family)